MMRRAILLALSSAALLSCGAPEPAADAGPPSRIISLIPSATETIIALGAGERLVARTDFDEDTLLADLPTVGGGLTPSLEALAALEPDLVVAWPDNVSRSVSGRLTELGIELYMPEAQSLDDIYRVTEEIGDILELEAAADSISRSIRESLGELNSAMRGLEPRSVFYVIWHDPPTTVGPGTYIHELIQLAGGENLFFDAPGLWPQVSMEEVVSRDPDIIILPAGEGPALEPESLRGMVGWRALRAVREGRVVQVDANAFNRPGPHVAEVARHLARIIHPEAFRSAAR